MRKELDLRNYPKKNQYEWFHTFPDPTYGIDVSIDVSLLVRLSKERKESFFPYFLFAVMQGVNSVFELRLREEKGKVYEYDRIHPTFTVMTDSGVYENTGCLMTEDFTQFYRDVEAAIEQVRHCSPTEELNTLPLCAQSDVVYATCLPNLNYVSMRHPIPAGNYDSLTVPRICWGKYHPEADGNEHVTLNITVSHTLVDGYPLSACFRKIQELCLEPKTFERK
jgi:chloramphenicol O-acetyltransferase type A